MHHPGAAEGIQDAARAQLRHVVAGVDGRTARALALRRLQQGRGPGVGGRAHLRADHDVHRGAVAVGGGRRRGRDDHDRVRRLRQRALPEPRYPFLLGTPGTSPIHARSDLTCVGVLRDRDLKEEFNSWRRGGSKDARLRGCNHKFSAHVQARVAGKSGSFPCPQCARGHKPAHAFSAAGVL
eukprot:556330-Rhodomonas_salina.3